MRSLPSSFLTEKNKLFNEDPWLLLVELQVSDTQSFYLTNSMQSITSNGDIFDPYPLEIDKIVVDSLENPFVTQLKVSNITRQIMAFVEQDAGLSGRTCIIQVFNSANLDDTAEHKFKIIECSVDNNELVFDISFFNLRDANFPNSMVSRNHCRWVFGSTKCGVDLTNLAVYNSAVDDPCTKKLTGDFGCIFWGARELADAGVKAHPERYGAFPGLPALIRV